MTTTLNLDDASSPNKNTTALQALGQQIWLDNITRDLLDDGTLAHYIRTLSVSGLTSNPTIFERAIGAGTAYDAEILRLSNRLDSPEAVFFALATQDLRRAADLFHQLFNRSDALRGWVSLEVSPRLASDSAATLRSAIALQRQVDRANLFIKIPGTEAGLQAIEESILIGIPINVTLLFSPGQCALAAEAYMRGLERRIAAGLHPEVASVASLFVSRWDVAANKSTPVQRHNQLGIAVATLAYHQHCERLQSARWKRLEAAGARPQRLLWASTGTKDATASDTLYIGPLAADDTINTLPEATLLAFAEHGHVDAPMARDGVDAQRVIDAFAALGIECDALAAHLQLEGLQAFDRSWVELLTRISVKMRARPHGVRGQS